MSKVKIQGNASGTGTLTITAPNTDTDRSLTLPDGAGEILTNAEGSVESAITTQLSHRNLIINGGFDVWQRGTSFSISSSVPYTADRWKIGGGTSTTVSRQTFTVGQTDVPSNPTYYCRWDITNSSQNYEFTQKIENVGTSSGQSLTISYYAKRNSGTLNPQLQIVQDFGSGGSSTVVTTVATPSLTSSWTKYNYTVSVPSISGKTLGSNHCLYVRWFIPNTNTGQIDIAQVQAEVGSVATPFEHRSYGEELARCQRYYQKIGGGSNNLPLFPAWKWSYTTGFFTLNLPVHMRTAPTIGSPAGTSLGNFRGNGSNESFDLSDLTSQNSSTITPLLTISLTLNPANDTVYIVYIAENKTLTLDAEL